MRFTMTIVAIILGTALFRQFNVDTLRFDKPGLGILYLLVFIASIFFLIKGNKKTKPSDE